MLKPWFSRRRLTGLGQANPPPAATKWLSGRETHTKRISAGAVPATDLLVEVYDRDTFGREGLGAVQVPLRELRLGPGAASGPCVARRQ